MLAVHLFLWKGIQTLPSAVIHKLYMKEVLGKHLVIKLNPCITCHVLTSLFGVWVDVELDSDSLLSY